MNVLEYILEEIEEKIKLAGRMMVEKPCDKLDEIANDTAEAFIGAYEECSEIIRSHMDDLMDVDAEEKYILCTIGEDGMLTPYNDTYDVIIHCSSKENQDQTVEMIKRFNWILVSEHLPEVPEGTEDDDCPEFNVTIKGADKATTLKYSPDGTWFDELGEVYQVVAWQPLPEPYKPEEGINT